MLFGDRTKQRKGFKIGTIIEKKLDIRGATAWISTTFSNISSTSRWYDLRLHKLIIVQMIINNENFLKISQLTTSGSILKFTKNTQVNYRGSPLFQKDCYALPPETDWRLLRVTTRDWLKIVTRYHQRLTEDWNALPPETDWRLLRVTTRDWLKIGTRYHQRLTEDWNALPPETDWRLLRVTTRVSKVKVDTDVQKQSRWISRRCPAHIVQVENCNYTFESVPACT